MDKVKVSVIIPVYNAASTLRRCINSALSQTLDKIEVICVDDGSSDGSAELLDSISDPRVRVIRQENKFAGAARNAGIMAAAGDYITFLDADDIYYSDNVLNKLYRCAARHNADMVKGGFRYIDNDSKTISSDDFSRNSSIGILIRVNPKFRSHPKRFMHTADVPWNGIYRKKFLVQNDILFNGLKCVNDHSFYIHCLIKAQKMRFVYTNTVLYTINQNNSLVAAKLQNFTSQIQSYKIVEGICRSEPDNIRRAIMRQELAGVFSLYERLDSAAKGSAREELSELLHNVDEQTIGRDYLRSFEWAELYSEIRYGTSIKREKLPLLRRISECYQEHGAVYTLKTIFRRFTGG